MGHAKECNCDHGITNFRSVKFEISGSRILLKCTECNGIVDWWEQSSTKKLMPFKQEWSPEERLVMR
jgi:hypothetical protein